MSRTGPSLQQARVRRRRRGNRKKIEKINKRLIGAFLFFIFGPRGQTGRGEDPPAEGGGNARGEGGVRRQERKPYPFKSKWDIAVREKERRGRRKRN